MAKRDLKSRLRGNARARGVLPDAAAPAEPTPPPVRGGANLRAYLARRAERSASRVAPPEPVALSADGVVEAGERGAFWVWRQRWPLAARHGSVPFALCRDADWQRLAVLAKDPWFEGARLDDCLFVDTETTGLSGGAGTVVFLTGMAFVECDELVLEQVFLRSFDEEPGALAHVARRLCERPVQVSFVGKSFDRHRLANRMVLHGIDTAPVLDPRHLDLYYLARRLWGEELPNCRLRTVEEHRLAFRRPDDLPGSEAPRAWVEWLRDGTGPVDKVLQHNRDDVLSLVALLGLLGRAAT